MMTADDFFIRMSGLKRTTRVMTDRPLNLTKAQQSIYDDLSGDLITWEEAAERLKKLPPAWVSVEWKSNRKRLIKAMCEKCGQSEGIMVIQHPYHPPSIVDIINSMAGPGKPLYENLKEEIKTGLSEEYARIKPEQRESCPKCGSISLIWHKTDQAWKCKSYTGHSWNRRSVCGNSFTEPAYVVDLTPASKNDIARLNDRVYEESLAAFTQSNQDWWTEVCVLHGKAAVLESLRWSSWYLSMDDTQTYCKKCAFKEDKFFIQS